MSLNALLPKLQQRHQDLVVTTDNCEYTYGELHSQLEHYRRLVKETYALDLSKDSHSIAIQSEYSFKSIAAFLAILAEGHIATLLSPRAKHIDSKLEEAYCQWLWRPDQDEQILSVEHELRQEHPLMEQLQQRGEPGFVVFSSGSSTKPKAVLHNLTNFTRHLQDVRKRKSTLAFLMFDHIAGIDTLMYTLFAGGSLAIPSSRSVTDVLSTVQHRKIEVLPASPSFLRMLYLDGNRQQYNLSSLQIVTYGSEPMSESTLDAVKKVIPNAKFIQKYGTSEFGSPRTQTKKGGELWMKLDSEHLATKVVDSVLWVRASSMMCGYLNAEQPLVRDGWLCTGDRVEMEGDWYRILGRDSEMINVGGEKVFPHEVEAVIEELAEVSNAVVCGEPHAILGQIVHAKVNLNVDVAKPKALVRKHCLSLLENYKVPSKVSVVTEPLRSERQKKIRR